jgi:hypothetical protein
MLTSKVEMDKLATAIVLLSFVELPSDIISLYSQAASTVAGPNMPGPNDDGSNGPI